MDFISIVKNSKNRTFIKHFNFFFGYNCSDAIWKMLQIKMVHQGFLFAVMLIKELIDSFSFYNILLLWEKFYIKKIIFIQIKLIFFSIL